MVLSNRLPILAAEVRRAHAEAEAAAQTAIARAIDAGRALVEAKALVRHGEWLPWLAEVGIPKRVAQRYMALAQSGLKSDTVTLMGGMGAALRFLALRGRMQAKLAAAEDSLDQLKAEGPVLRTIPACMRLIEFTYAIDEVRCLAHEGSVMFDAEDFDVALGAARRLLDEGMIISSAKGLE